ncbi:MAG: hypothetical protein RLY31_3148 [Bacteroidota bacterium]
MKLSWGQGIAAFYSFFAVLMVGMVFYSKGLDHSLVEEDYYRKDLQYQQVITAMENTASLSRDVEISRDRQREVLGFLFPAEATSPHGTIHFYRPSDKQMDFTIPVRTDGNGYLEYPYQQLPKGRWTVKVNWTAAGKDYYSEQIVVL